MRQATFCHLHVHSHFSLLDGLAKIDALIETAKIFGMPALALTDHGVMYGTIEFYQKARQAGIKPILGLEIYLSPRGMEDKQAKIDSSSHHLVLLAKNLEGYQNLLKITSAAHLKGYYYKPRIDKEFLARHCQGLIALTACLHGEIPAALVSGDNQKAEELARQYREIFGPDNFYLELQHHPNIPEQKIANDKMIALGKKLNIPLVATNDVHYLDIEDRDAQEVLLCVQTGKMFDDPKRLSMRNEDFSFKTPAQMEKDFAGNKEAIENTAKIANMCDVKLTLGQFIFPKLKIENGLSAEKKLEKICYENLPKLYPNPTAEIKNRLSHELKIIEKTGFANYMLVVADYTNFAFKHNISTNTRGSAAGSLVAYLLGITNIDPLKYGLLFERFLNEERISWPDVDLDIADSRRAELIDYITKKYGQNNVAQIITFGTIAARNGIRDTGRVLGMPYSDVDEIAKLIPFGATLKEALENVSELRLRYQREPEIKRLFDLAKKLEGVARHASVHAAGLVMADKPLVEYVPLQLATKGETTIVTQYEMHSLEDVGLVKMDLLGLANLSIIDNALRIIKKTREEKINIEKIPLDDKKTYKLLSSGKTSGVFQLESEGMKRYLKELKPSNIHDVMAMVSLYRPGPIELIPEFIAGKHGYKKITYLHPKLEPILAETYGVAVYQEQVLQIARDICGFSLGQADILRKAIGKKIKKLLLEQKEKWIEGAVQKGVAKSIASKLFEFVEPFARYGFNKAHAASYAMIAYRTAYLKEHYGPEFVAAWLTSEEGRDIEKIAFALNEAKNMGIQVLPPDINKSFVDFGVIKETNEITYALASIKNVGRGAAEAIVEEKKERGKYSSLEDFLTRVKPEIANKKIIESLAKAGALDEFAERNQILAGIDVILKFIQSVNKNKSSNQLGLFGLGNAKIDISLVSSLPKVPPAEKSQRLSWEKELLGMYVSEHPLSEYEHIWQNNSIRRISDLQLDEKNQIVTVAGVVTNLRKINTKNNAEMAFVKIEDVGGQVEAVVFPRVFEEAKTLLYKDAPITVSGKISDKDNVVKILADEIKPISSIKSAQQRLFLTFPAKSNKDLLLKVKEIVLRYPGESDLILRLPKDGQYKEVKAKQRVEINNKLIKDLEKLLGEEAIETR